MEHLTSDAASWLNETNEDRIEAIISDKWIVHLEVQRILTRIAELHQHPVSHRMPNLLIVGDSNSGKSAILKNYSKQYKYNPNPSLKRAKSAKAPVLMVQIMDGPNEAVLYETILDSIKAPYAPKARLETRRWHVIHLLRDMGVQLLFLDELHHILMGSPLQQRKFLAGLKYLANELQIPLVCAGIETAYNAICLDEQLANRFEFARLTRWTMNQDFLRLLASFERVLALRKPSHLIETSLAFKLLEMSGGSIGRLGRLLKQAAVHAVHTGTECITLQTLKEMTIFPLVGDSY